MSYYLYTLLNWVVTVAQQCVSIGTALCYDYANVSIMLHAGNVDACLEERARFGRYLVIYKRLGKEVGTFLSRV